MKRIFAIVVAGFSLALLGSPAVAKPEAKKPDQVLRCAHTYAEAMAEAKDRSCVVFVTIHEDG